MGDAAPGAPGPLAPPPPVAPAAPPGAAAPTLIRTGTNGGLAWPSLLRPW